MTTGELNARTLLREFSKEVFLRVCMSHRMLRLRPGCRGTQACVVLNPMAYCEFRPMREKLIPVS